MAGSSSLERPGGRPCQPAAPRVAQTRCTAHPVVAWRATQARFVDDPAEAIGEADVLIQRVMRDRGYPTEDFEQRAADVSVDHPDVVNNYRAAHGISVAHLRGKASTEDLRQALVHYRALFDELLESREPERAGATKPR